MKVIHIDADCFYAAIEMRENPALCYVPLAVGGAANRRGVLCTCNYEARRYGVRSAMSSAYALKLCPNLTIVPTNMSLYSEASAVMREIFAEYTDLVEPLSLDEAFLDVSASEACHNSATLMAKEIRQRIAKELGITVSAGVAPNKFLAKVASDWQKPDGLTVIAPKEVDAFVSQLPVKKIPGVGKVTQQKLAQLGIEYCRDVQSFSETILEQHFGSFGAHLLALSKGVDERSVKPERQRKSLSVEHTYPIDLPHVRACLSELPQLYQRLLERLRRLDRSYSVLKGFLKIKFADFTSTTIERVDSQVALKDYRSLLQTGYERGQKPVRLLGVGVRLTDQPEREPRQMCFGF